MRLLWDGGGYRTERGPASGPGPPGLPARRPPAAFTMSRRTYPGATTLAEGHPRTTDDPDPHDGGLRRAVQPLTRASHRPMARGLPNPEARGPRIDGAQERAGPRIAGVRVPGGSRIRGVRLRSGQALAGAASAAAAKVDQPAPIPDPTAGAFFDVDNTLMRGASIYYFARGLAARKMFGARDLAGDGLEAGLLPGPRRGEPRAHRCGPGGGAGVRGRAQGDRHRRAVRGDLRRGHGRPDLGGHPRAGPAPPGGRPAGLAGDRHPGRAGQHHRPPAGPDRRARHRRRVGGRRIHGPPGRGPAARPGEGGGHRGARRPGGTGPGTVRRLQRLRQRPAHAAPGRPPGRGQPRRGHSGRRHGPTTGRCTTSVPAAKPR